MSEQIWTIENQSISWTVKEGQTHLDDIEMSGLFVDLIAGYGTTENGSLFLNRHCYFPTLRTIPNNTHGTYRVSFEGEGIPVLLSDGFPVVEYPEKFTLDGTLKINCKTRHGIDTERIIFPSPDTLACYEIINITAKKEVKLSLSLPQNTVFSYGRGTKGVYIATVQHDFTHPIELSKTETLTFGIRYGCHISGKKEEDFDYLKALEKRKKRVAQLCDQNLVLKTNIPELDTMTRFAKLRAGESIFQTLSGKFHSPGGRAYYAAIWCNDQIEYSGPHFATTNDQTAIEAALNAYRAYIPFMSDSYHRLPSSIIAEGLDIWEGAGDRGDAAMYLYGASLFCLYLGDEQIAKELFPAISWCAEYCERKRLPEGVISSDTDELEGRFPTDGRANLSTSCLCYGGLRLAAKLAASLGEHDVCSLYNSRADKLLSAIEGYFGAELHGFRTYRYSKGYNTLRAWICMPICVGINNRKEDTINAMISPYLWREEGMLTCEKGDENQSDTIWDRSTLYGMKCAFMCGMGEKMLDKLIKYCRKRLLCDRVPYPVEAYPEGGRRHLSGESALFVRIITEGILSVIPQSLNSFSFIPSLPEGLEHLSLEKLNICGASFDIIINKTSWEVKKNGKTIKNGTVFNQQVLI